MLSARTAKPTKAAQRAIVIFIQCMKCEEGLTQRACGLSKGYLSEGTGKAGGGEPTTNRKCNLATGYSGDGADGYDTVCKVSQAASNTGSVIRLFRPKFLLPQVSSSTNNAGRLAVLLLPPEEASALNTASIPSGRAARKMADIKIWVGTPPPPRIEKDRAPWTINMFR